MNSSNWILGFGGAVVGAVVGYYAYVWLIHQGLYAIALPGFCVGLGAGMALKERSLLIEIFCFLLGTFMGFLCEWRYFPFAADKSLTYFFMHLHLLRSITWILILIGAFLGYRMSRKRPRTCSVDPSQEQE